MKTRYDLSNDELVKELMNASARVGVSSSGLVIDCASYSHRTDMWYLQGIVLSRLSGLNPPISPEGNQLVKAKKKSFAFRAPEVVAGQTCKVNRVWYNEGKWKVTLCSLTGQEFEGSEGQLALYLLEDFEVVEEKPVAV